MRQLGGADVDPAAFCHDILGEPVNCDVIAHPEHFQALLQVIGGVGMDVDIDVFERQHGEIIRDHLALRRQQRAIAHFSSLPVVDRMGHGAPKQVQHVRSGQADNVAVWKNAFHLPLVSMVLTHLKGATPFACTEKPPLT